MTPRKGLRRLPPFTLSELDPSRRVLPDRVYQKDRTACVSGARQDQGASAH